MVWFGILLVSFAKRNRWCIDTTCAYIVLLRFTRPNDRTKINCMYANILSFYSHHCVVSVRNNKTKIQFFSVFFSLSFFRSVVFAFAFGIWYFAFLLLLYLDWGQFILLKKRQTMHMYVLIIKRRWPNNDG